MRRTNRIPWGVGGLFALALILLGVTAGSAIAEKSSKPRRTVPSKHGGVASAEGPDFTRFRVVTDQGILVVFDADEEWDGRLEPDSQLAYWHDFATEQLFFFDQLLFTEGDVLQSVAAMQRDLGIDPAPILVEKPEFAPLPDITSPGVWRPAIESEVLAVMAGGGVAGAIGEGEVSGLNEPCVPGSCPIAMSASGPLVAPVRGTPREELFAMAQGGSGCDCGGGGWICLPGPIVGCTDDGNPCTMDYGPCSNLPSYCIHPALPDGTSCLDDGNACTLTDTCLSGVCTGSNPVVCTALDQCHNVGTCNTGTGVCSNPNKANGSACSDGNACTQTDTCQSGVCTGSNPVVCTAIDQCHNVGTCNTGTGVCSNPNKANGAACDDGNACTVSDYCSGGTCLSGAPMNCNDGNPCTDDICDSGDCTHPPGNDGAACDDDDPCTDGDHCETGSCLGTRRPCDDNIGCTVDSCNSATGACENAPNDAPCNDGKYCTGVETCDAHGCQPGVNPCAPMACREATHECYGCGSNAECDDGWFCNGIETCLLSECQSGVAPCSPPQFCHETLQACVACLIDADCADDNACTQDICTNNACILGQPVNCSTTDLCLLWSCDPASGCVYTEVCDDGDPCTFDTCNAQATPMCENQDIRQLADSCTQNGWNHSATPPAMVFVNNDDDNGNGVADYLDTGPVTGEDDLVLVPISVGWGPVLQFPKCYCEDTSEYHVDALQGTGAFFGVFLNPDKTGVATWSASGAGAVFVSGQRATSACGAPMELTTVCCSAMHTCTATTEPVVVAAVESLTWEKADPGNADLELDAPINGGVRIFPDKLSPEDLAPTLRQRVNLVATVEPPTPGVTVYFVVFDVDDPFDQLNPFMPDVTLIDANAIGPDNRPIGQPDPAVGFYQATTGADGQPNDKVRVPITVSMQPGNNYRAGASLIQAARTQSTTYGGQTVNPQQHADALNALGGSWSGYSTPLTWSQMLTVWRKLTLEVDSMGAESQEQQDRESNGFEWGRVVVPPPSMDIPAPIQVDVPAPGFTSLLGYMVPNPVPCDSAYDNRWEGGALVPPGSSSEYLVVRNSCTLISGQTLSKFILWGNPGNLSELTSVIRDDDPYFIGGAPSQLPQTSVLTPDIVAAYRDAYVEIVEATGDLNPRQLVPWDSNLSTEGLWADYNFGSGIGTSWDLSTSNGFWVRRVVVCYQGKANEDFDSDQYENATVSQNVEIPLMAPYPSQALSSLQNTVDPYTKSGITIRGTVFTGTALTTVYKETIRDKDVRSDTAKFWQYVAHEIGHATVGSSGFASGEVSDHGEGGLLTVGDDLQNLPGMQRFSATTCVRFRNTVKW